MRPPADVNTDVPSGEKRAASSNRLGERLWLLARDVNQQEGTSGLPGGPFEDEQSAGGRVVAGQSAIPSGVVVRRCR